MAENDTEITFNNISWLSDKESSMDKLSDYIYPYFSVDYLDGGEGLFLRQDDELFARPVKTNEYTDISTCISINSIRKSIAGYNVKKIRLTFANKGSESQLICVQIDLEGSQFDDLQTKLIKVYGAGETKESEEGLLTAFWNGLNNTCVLLYSVDGGESADLLYGRLDAEKVLDDCALFTPMNVDHDDISGL